LFITAMAKACWALVLPAMPLVLPVYCELGVLMLSPMNMGLPASGLPLLYQVRVLGATVVGS
jgi:hypothetical protein